MNKKTIWTIIIVAILAIVALVVFSFIFGFKSEQKTLSGQITSINSEAIAFDGPHLITIKTAEGDEAVISVPSMGINLCPSSQSITNVAVLKVGMTVEVEGSIEKGGVIVPCELDSHYFSIVR